MDDDELIRALSASDSHTRHAVLGKFGLKLTVALRSPSSGADRWIEAMRREPFEEIVRTMRDMTRFEPATRANAAEVLGLFEDPRALPHLVSGVHDPHSFVQNAALPGLFKLRTNAGQSAIRAVFQKFGYDSDIGGMLWGCRAGQSWLGYRYWRLASESAPSAQQAYESGKRALANGDPKRSKTKGPGSNFQGNAFRQRGLCHPQSALSARLGAIGIG